MTIASKIQNVARFAGDKQGASLGDPFEKVYFRAGEVYALSPTGGACEQVELKLSCGVDAKRLLKALKACAKKGDEVKLIKDGDSLVVQGSGVAKLDTVSLHNSPKLEKPSDLQWLAAETLDQVKRVGWAVDHSRSNYSGVYLGPYGLEATNGHVFCRLGGCNFEELLGAGVMIQPHMLVDLPSPTWIARAEGTHQVFITSDTDSQAYRVAGLLAGTPFSGKEVIARAQEQPQLEVDRAALVEVVKRAKNSGVIAKLEIDEGRLGIQLESGLRDNLFAFADTIEFEHAGNEEVPDGIIGLSLVQLLPMIEACTSETIRIGVKPDPTGGLDPIYVEDEQFIGVLMPYRL